MTDVKEATETVLNFAEKWADGTRRDREEYEKAALLVRSLLEDRNELRASIKHFFAPGPGIATPEYYYWPDGQLDNSEPHKKTWNEKLDRLKAALGESRTPEESANTDE